MTLREFPTVVTNKLYKLTHKAPRSIEGLFTSVPRWDRKIPNQVFMTWKEPRLTPLHAWQVEKFRRRNNDFSFEFFDDARMSAYMEQHFAGRKILDVFRHVKVMASKADIWRYCILYCEGGVYCDIDSSLLVPLRDLLADDPAEALSFEGNSWRANLKVGVYADPNHYQSEIPSAAASLLDYPDHIVLNWFLAFAPGHPILAQAIGLIEDSFLWFKERNFDAVWPAVVHSTGPLALTQATWKALEQTGKRPFQYGIDWNGRGQYKVYGSEDRLEVSPTYFHLTNQTLGKDPL